MKLRRFSALPAGYAIFAASSVKLGPNRPQMWAQYIVCISGPRSDSAALRTHKESFAKPVDALVTGFTKSPDLLARSLAPLRRLKHEGIIRNIHCVTWDSPELDVCVAPLNEVHEVQLTRMPQSASGRYAMAAVAIHGQFSSTWAMRLQRNQRTASECAYLPASQRKHTAKARCHRTQFFRFAGTTLRRRRIAMVARRSRILSSPTALASNGPPYQFSR